MRSGEKKGGAGLVELLHDRGHFKLRIDLPADPDQKDFLEALRAQVLDEERLRGKILTDDLNDIDLQVIAVEKKLRELSRLALPLSLLKP